MTLKNKYSLNSMIEISSFIKKLRKHYGLTQEQLAEKIGCTVSHLGKIETNAYNPSIDFIEKIFTALDIPPSSLLNELSSQATDRNRHALLIEIHKSLLELKNNELKWLIKLIETAKEKPPRD